RRAADAYLRPPEADRRLELRIDQLVCQLIRLLEEQVRCPALVLLEVVAQADLHRVLRDEAPRLGRLGELLADAGVELLPDARDAEEVRGLDLLQVLRQLLERLHIVHMIAARRVAMDGEDLLADMRERQCPKP